MSAVVHRPTKIVLVDLDDTLVDRSDHNVTALQKTFQAFFKQVPLDELTNCVNENLLLKKYRCDWKSFWTRFDDFDDRQKGIAAGIIKLYPDTYSFLDLVTNNHLTAIVTDTPPPKCLIEVKEFGLDRYLVTRGVVYYVLDHPQFKPKPDVSVALRALERCNYIPHSHRHHSTPDEMDHIWVVGDSHKDIFLARQLKAYFCHNHIRATVHSIYIHRRGPEEPSADYITMGPYPLLAAGLIIASHIHRIKPPSKPQYICAPDMPPTSL